MPGRGLPAGGRRDDHHQHPGPVSHGRRGPGAALAGRPPPRGGGARGGGPGAGRGRAGGGGGVSFANWQYFGSRYAAYTAGFALGLAWVVTVQVHAMRRIARNATAGRPRRGGLAGALAAVVSLLPSLLCCSPVVPTLVGLIGLPAATQLQTTGTITYFFATRQDWLLGGALARPAARGPWAR